MELLKKLVTKRNLILVMRMWLALKFISFLRSAIEGRRRIKLLLKIPTVHPKEEDKYKPNWFGTVKSIASDDRLSTHDGLQRYYYPLVKKLFHENLKDEKMGVIWILNPNVTLVFPLAIVLVTDMDLVRELLSTKMLSKQRKGNSYLVANPLTGNGALTTSHGVWHKQRIILDKGFTQSILEEQFFIIKESSNELLDLLTGIYTRSGERDLLDIDLIESMSKMTLDVLGKVAFGYDIGALRVKDGQESPLYDAFSVVLNTLQHRIQALWLHLIRNFPTAENKKFNEAINLLNNTVKDIIKNKKNKVKSKKKSQDLLDILLESDMEEDIILDNIRTLLFAGHDTTAAALTWAFYLLSQHQNVQENILKEFEDKFKSNFDNLSAQKLEEAEYLNAVVLEVLRLYPSAGFVRHTLEDIEVGGYVIPKGVDVGFYPYVIQRDEKYYKNAEEFIPQRWMSRNKEKIFLQAQLAKMTLEEAYLPFSLGKRNCVGRKLALLEMRVSILNVLNNFEIKPAIKQHDKFQPEPWRKITLTPQHVRVSFKPKRK
eukprot:maker-scaffold_10-snap-gene-11.2-mRNA-1 protein AED:0.00 eAED:0.00 QI:66/1/1/1/1/1/2/111/542